VRGPPLAAHRPGLDGKAESRIHEDTSRSSPALSSVRGQRREQHNHRDFGHGILGGRLHGNEPIVSARTAAGRSRAFSATRFAMHAGGGRRLYVRARVGEGHATA
jgi:hypothetical protein